MRKLKGEKPERRTIRKVFRVTKTEDMQIERGYTAAAICETDYMRSLVLGASLSAAPKALTMDRAISARIMGALNEIGSQLAEIKEIVAIGECPYEARITSLESRVEMVANNHMALLEKQ